MKGAKEVIEALNEVLAGELVAINQYFLHAKMCASWGFSALAAQMRTESIEEMRHAEQIVDRILFLDGVPNLQRLDKLHIGETVAEQLKSDLELEHHAIARLRDAMGVCRDKGDRSSEDLVAAILAAEERHVDWLETQLGLIDKIGEKHYLAAQVGTQTG